MTIISWTQLFPPASVCSALKGDYSFMKSCLFRSFACILGLLLVAACDGKGAASADTTSNFTTAADALSVRLKAGVPPVKDPAVAGFEAEASRGLQTLGT